MLPIINHIILYQEPQLFLYKEHQTFCFRLSLPKHYFSYHLVEARSLRILGVLLGL